MQGGSPNVPEGNHERILFEGRRVTSAWVQDVRYAVVFVSKANSTGGTRIGNESLGKPDPRVAVAAVVQYSCELPAFKITLPVPVRAHDRSHEDYMSKTEIRILFERVRNDPGSEAVRHNIRRRCRHSTQDSIELSC